MANDKEFANLVNFTQSVDKRLRDDPEYKGAEPDNKPVAPLFASLDEDEFGGNDNNRRVAKREAKERQVVKGEANVADLKDTLKANNAEVAKEQAKESTPKTADEPYQKFTAEGKPVWTPNS